MFVAPRQARNNPTPKVKRLFLDPFMVRMIRHLCCGYGETRVRLSDTNQPLGGHMRHNVRFASVLILSTLISILLVTAAPAPDSYYPPPGEWARKKPAEVGMDAAKLDDAVAFMKSHESSQARDFSDQEIIFGKLLGSVPTERAATNGLIIRHGYIVAEFGDTTKADPTYSAAKSMLSTIAGIALQRRLIPGLDDPVVNV